MTSERSVQAVVAFLHALSQSSSMAALYSPDHPRVTALLPRILDSMQQVFSGLPELAIIVFNDDLLYQGKPLVQDVSLVKLAKLFSRNRIGHVTFVPSLDGADIRSFIRLLHGTDDMHAFIKSTPGIKIGTEVVSDANEEQQMITGYSDITREQFRELQSQYDAVANGQALETQQLKSMVAGFIIAFRREYNPLMALTPLRNMDEYTFTHSINVGILNIAQGMSLGISGELLHDLGVAGMLHDAGKIFVDRSIIQKPGKLTDEEFAVMKTHPVRGAQYLMGQEGVPKLAVISAFEHHMRFDVQGYPQPPTGWHLNLCSQMTMISDTFDALRTKRIYKDPWDFPVVCSHMLTLAGSQLNADLTVNFLDMLARMGDGLPPAQLDDSVPARSCYCE
jgi:HD-GYP domain-containing protein (c-di-GMP phosphodiesterase class II)